MPGRLMEMMRMEPCFLLPLLYNEKVAALEALFADLLGIMRRLLSVTSKLLMHTKGFALTCNKEIIIGEEMLLNIRFIVTRLPFEMKETLN